MSDILIIPNGGRSWVLGLRKGVVVRLSDRKPTSRIRLAIACHCGAQDDNPDDLARMRATYAREEAMNGRG